MNRWRRTMILLVVGLLLGGCVGGGASPTPAATPTATATAEPSARPSASPSASPSGSPSAPATPSPVPTTTAPPTGTPHPTQSPTRFVDYAVVAGDTLASIAARHATTWQSLLFWNRERYPSLDPAHPTYDPHLVRVGWVLRLQPGVVVPFEAPLPTPPPTAIPTSAPVAGSLVTNGSRQSNRVALTLDMGGRVGDALAIMGWLRDHGVAATIFMTGSMAESPATDAGRQVLGMIDARPDLFDLGNHTYGHPVMTALTPSAMAAEISSAEAAIARHAATSPRPLFRPPEGAWNATLVSTAASIGYRWTVMWDVDTIDWRPIADGGPTAQQMVDKVLTRTQGGSIVLMHLGGYETLEALPAIVSGLRARGYAFVTLGTLLGG